MGTTFSSLAGCWVQSTVWKSTDCDLSGHLTAVVGVMEGSCWALSWKCSTLALIADYCTSVSEDSVWQCKLWPFPLIYEERRSQQHEETCQGKFLIAWNATLRQQPVISGSPSPSTTWHDFCTSFSSEVLQFPEGQEQLERPDEPCPPQRQLTAVWD